MTSNCLKILDTGPASAETNMQIDRELLHALQASDLPMLHFYDWETPSVTYGYFMSPEKAVGLSTKNGLQLARRPTGGGMLLHMNSFDFSLFLPASHPSYTVNTLENYAFVNQMVGQAIHQFSGGSLSPELLLAKCDNSQFCMAEPTINDLMIQGRKIVGGAQRRTRNGFLHQGTVTLQKPPIEYLRKLFSSRIAEKMEANSCALLEGSCHLIDIQEAKQVLKRILVTLFQKMDKA